MLVFRKMTENDIDAIAVLEAHIFSDAWSKKSICDTFLNPQAFVTVAETEGEIAGYCIVYHVLDEGEIARIAVAPDKRRQGAARGLLDYTCKLCVENGIRQLLLDVRESNEGARSLYQDYGFQTDGVRKHFYRNPTENAVLMSKGIGCSSH